jgi:hypothetical protein
MPILPDQIENQPRIIVYPSIGSPAVGTVGGQQLTVFGGTAISNGGLENVGDDLQIDIDEAVGGAVRINISASVACAWPTDFKIFDQGFIAVKSPRVTQLGTTIRLTVRIDTGGAILFKVGFQVITHINF